MEIPISDDKEYNLVKAEQIILYNSQASTILLASLCREEYNKVNGLERTKEIWNTLKTTHEGDKITKLEPLEGELR
jgi:flagellar motor switch protein FliG